MKTHIVVHHSLTKDGREVNWGAIRNYHVNENGWADIGYNFGIENINGIYECLIGRLPTDRGAHCIELNMNKVSIGICVTGNFDKEAPNEAQLSKLRGLCRYLMATYSILPENVLGHGEVQLKSGMLPELTKTCPGKLFDMHKFRQSLKEV